VIALDSWGYVVMSSMTPSERRNQYGSRTLEPRYLALGLGKHLAVPMHLSLPEPFPRRTSPVEQGASDIPIPLPGLAMSAINMVRFGRNVTIGEGFTFAVVPLFDPTHNPGC